MSLWQKNCFWAKNQGEKKDKREMKLFFSSYEIKRFEAIIIKGFILLCIKSTSWLVIYNLERKKNILNLLKAR